ncbi:MAG: hypothetical protein QOE36_2105 [Gaiellaceae bacterium]|jgi:hypothetical protein|nr:hypothetical protein [Gaiellaceae bacterium]
MVVVAALGFVGSARADAFYNDSNHERPTSWQGQDAFADIDAVAVSNDAATKRIAFRIAVPNMSTLEDHSQFDIDITPAHARLGARPTYYLAIDNGGTLLRALRSRKGKRATDITSRYARGVLTVTLAAADIGSPGAFDFRVDSARGLEGNFSFEDHAPDWGRWTYKMTARSRLPGLDRVKAVAAPPPHPPESGHSVVMAGLRVVLLSGSTAKANHLRCTAVLGSKRLKGKGAARCKFRLPGSAGGKILVVTRTGRYGSETVVSTDSYAVR